MSRARDIADIGDNNIGAIVGTNGITLGGVTVNDWNSLGFASGTIMLFQQTSAPTGWTKITTHDNKALRVVSGTVGSGGSSGFTTALGTPSLSGSTGNTTLSTSQMPSHNHGLRYGCCGSQSFSGGGIFMNTTSGGQTYTGTNADFSGNNTSLMSSSGGGGSHNHTLSGTAAINVQYVDVIFASKD